jgi:hypothetical protein
MPIEKRDLVSKAKLFVPTASERTLRKSQVQLDNELKEVQGLKAELQRMMDEIKNK